MNITEAVNIYITRWKCRGYFENIPDEIPTRLDELNKAPSYKRIAIAILKNDTQYIGVSPPKSKWYSVLKSIELSEGKKTQQLRLFHTY